MKPDQLDLLREQLDDARPEVRGHAILRLRHSTDGRAILTRHLRSDPSGKIRAMCASFLEPQDDEVIRLLVAALDDDFPDVVIGACDQLARNRCHFSVPSIRKLLRSNYWMVRLAACEALLRLEQVDREVEQVAKSLKVAPEAERYNWLVTSSRCMDDFAPSDMLTVDELIDKIISRTSKISEAHT